MVVRKLGVSEARRLLPQLVESLVRDGGRVDVTWRGSPRVSIVRTAELAARALPAGLELQINVRASDLPEVIRELRGRSGQARPLPRLAARRGKRAKKS